MAEKQQTIHLILWISKQEEYNNKVNKVKPTKFNQQVELNHIYSHVQMFWRPWSNDLLVVLVIF